MIAEQIYKATQMQQQSFDTLSQNLAMLGQSVTNSLKQQADQRQFQQALPMLQGAYKNAMSKMASDDVSGGFSDLLSIQAAFGGINNPQIQNLNNNLLQLGMMAGQYRDKYNQRQAQYGGGIPATNQFDESWVTGQQAIDLEGELPEMDGAESPSRGFSISLRPEEERFQASLKGFQDSFTQRNDAKEVVKEIQNYPNLSPEEQDAVDRKSMAEEVPKGQKFYPFGDTGLYTMPNVAGLSLQGEIDVVKLKRELSQKSGAKLTGEQATKMVKEAEAANAFRNTLIDSDSLISFDPTASKIVKDANFDLKRIQAVAEDPEEERSPFQLYVDGNPVEGAIVSNDVGKALEFVRRSKVAVGKDYKFITRPQPTEAPAAEAAAGGMPAVQAAAPAKPVVPETEALRKQLTVFEEQEVKKTATERQNRIKQINKEIESLQRGSTQRYTGAGLPGAGTMATTGKTKRDIERDITKIEQLVAERDRLEGKTTARNLSPMDQQALDWANANPSDPRAQAIKQKLGL
jgi:hypothetical protein